MIPPYLLIAAIALLFFGLGWIAAHRAILNHLAHYLHFGEEEIAVLRRAWGIRATLLTLLPSFSKKDTPPRHHELEYP